MRSHDPHSLAGSANDVALDVQPGFPPSESVVYVIDDDASVREALRSLLRSAGLAVEAYASAGAFMARPAKHAGPCCLVLDLRLPDVSGLELQRELSRHGDAMPIIFITGHGDIPTTVQAPSRSATTPCSRPCDTRSSARDGCNGPTASSPCFGSATQA